jgi:signal peptidase I
VEIESEAQPKVGLAWWSEFARAWGPAILAVLLIRTYIFEPFRIPSGSMVPTLLIGDHVLVNKSAYGLWLPWTGVDIPIVLDKLWTVPRLELIDWGDPERGDIIVFRYPRDESLTYIKRVVAVSGDRVEVKNNQVVVNGEFQDRDYKGTYPFLDVQCHPRDTKRYVEDFGTGPHEILTNLGTGGLLANHREVLVPEGTVFVMGDNRDNSEDSRRWGIVRYDQIKGKAHLVWLSWDGCSGEYGGVRGSRFFTNLYAVPADASE